MLKGFLQGWRGLSTCRMELISGQLIKQKRKGVGTQSLAKPFFKTFMGYKEMCSSCFPGGGAS